MNNETLVIVSNGKYLSGVRDFVEKVSRQCGFSDDDIFDIKVAVSEAVSNAVEHGSPLRNANFVQIDALCDSEGVTFSVKDQGAFKKGMVAKESEVRGRGIKFMLALMDKVNFIESSEGTTVELRKGLSSKRF